MLREYKSHQSCQKLGDGRKKERLRQIGARMSITEQGVNRNHQQLMKQGIKVKFKVTNAIFRRTTYGSRTSRLNYMKPLGFLM